MFAGSQKPAKLFKHFKGSTYVLINDQVVDASIDGCAELVLYTDGEKLFVRPREEFYGLVPGTSEQRFTELDPLPPDLTND